ncbi:S8 family serine peptidase [Halobacteriovorax sp.]|uniref:S8 family serine peptidase n=1 Tax=Halobacteriovorax sp. TaxID=2020862 RepID=UPI003AF22A3D
MHKYTQHFIKALISLILVSSTYASTVVAISDNQIDIGHEKLRAHLYRNFSEYQNGYDTDRNGKVDDLNGWNFIHDTNKVFDPSLIGTFDPNVYKYYEVRRRKTLKIATDEELEWYKEIRKDDDFMDHRSDFSSYTHGSHVTCLAMNTEKLPYEMKSWDLKFMPIRYLGDNEVGLFKKKEFTPSKYSRSYYKIQNIKNYLNYYQSWMINKFEETVKYSASKSKIYHASWGQSWEPAYDMVNELFQDEFDISEKEADKKYKSTITKFRNDYMKGLMKKGQRVVENYSNLLFVFSAGNKKDNTDEMLHYPSSIIADNVISVGAIDEDNEDKAYFSNFGKTTVSLFAPGVAIYSCSPGDRYIPINGTSQAAPHVTNIAAKIFAMADYYAKPISPAHVKDILLSSATKKAKLSDLCVSGGTLNESAAIMTARRFLRW